jgi:hypothetical protein
VRGAFEIITLPLQVTGESEGSLAEAALQIFFGI